MAIDTTPLSAVDGVTDCESDDSVSIALVCSYPHDLQLRIYMPFPLAIQSVNECPFGEVEYVKSISPHMVVIWCIVC